MSEAESKPTEPPQPADPIEPQPPPEVEQAALLGHIDDAVSLYVKFTGIDPARARQVVERLAEG